MTLPLQIDLPPMEARSAGKIPEGSDWLYEPKWDGFRCLVFRNGGEVHLQSKSGQPLGRYFPELMQVFESLKAEQFVLDGEIVVPTGGGSALSFDQLLQRIHPAQSRIKRLAGETPAIFIVFDVLVDATGNDLSQEPLSQRRAALQRFYERVLSQSESIKLSPATEDLSVAKKWYGVAGSATDGLMAKKLSAGYASGSRDAMVKIKPIRTADCVVGGFRYASKQKVIGSLLLGLYDQDGLLHHIGYSSSLTAAQRREYTPKLEALIEAPGFTGSAPGGPSRWSTDRSTQWEPLRPELVVEVGWDHFTNGRFRHGTKFLRWRPDKSPRQCTMEQIAVPEGGSLTLLR